MGHARWLATALPFTAATYAAQAQMGSTAPLASVSDTASVAAPAVPLPANVTATTDAKGYQNALIVMLPGPRSKAVDAATGTLSALGYAPDAVSDYLVTSQPYLVRPPAFELTIRCAIAVVGDSVRVTVAGTGDDLALARFMRRQIGAEVRSEPVVNRDKGLMLEFWKRVAEVARRIAAASA